MRRDEFSVDCERAAEVILNEIRYGVLSLNDSEFPYGVPLNFAFLKDAVYFHGASAGRKYELAKNGAKAAFVAFKEYSYIPSFFMKTDQACTATQFFASVMLEGELRVLEDERLKARALQALMEKHQDKKSFLEFEKHLQTYRAMLKKTAIFELKIARQSTKIKVGQNMSEAHFGAILDELEKSDREIDRVTAKLMREYRPKK